jgi:phthalate 4,5-dioxygenase reductase subunit
MQDTDTTMLPLRVLRKACIATDIHLFELAHRDGAALPPAAAGSHITVLTPNGLTRRYSLVNGPGETQAWQIAVKREAAGLGGSASLVDQVDAGALLYASRPANYFSLDPAARSCVLVAGGIGITPVLAMARELRSRGAEFRLLYLVRSPEAAAFREELEAPELAGRVHIHYDHGDPARSLPLGPWLEQPAEGAHLYCCGPRGLMQAVREGTRHWPQGSVHFEDFGTSAAPAPLQAAEGAFTVRLARSGRCVEVAPGQSILHALRAEGIAAPSSCESGTCGACRTPLLAGVAEHRDYVLEEEEQRSEIMICVSRAVSPTLELDL